MHTYFGHRRSGSVDEEEAAPAGPSDVEPSDAAGSRWRQHEPAPGKHQDSMPIHAMSRDDVCASGR